MKDLKDYVVEAMNPTPTPTEEPTEEPTEKPASQNNTEEKKQAKSQDTQTEVAPKKVFTFDFTGLDNKKETIKSLQDMGANSGVTVDVESDKVTFEVNKNSIDKIDSIHSVINDYVHTQQKSAKCTNEEQYAAQIKAFGKVLADLDDYIDQCNG